MLGVSFPSNVQGGAPAAKAFLYILRQRNVSGSNNFVFLWEPKCSPEVSERKLSLTTLCEGT